MLLDASCMSDFLEKGPRYFYWRWLHNGTGIVPVNEPFKKDLVFGSIWAKFIDKFYQGESFESNYQGAKLAWEKYEQEFRTTPQSEYELNQIKTMPKALDKICRAYYKQFSHADMPGRKGEEEFKTQEGFVGRTDGWVEEAGLIHESKALFHKNNHTDTVWSFQNSLQTKLYAVAKQAKGIIYEFAFKDSPFKVVRQEVMPITSQQAVIWYDELMNIRASILLHIRTNRFLCNPNQCSIVGKWQSYLCPYKRLCEGKTDALPLFKPREEHLAVRR